MNWCGSVILSSRKAVMNIGILHQSAVLADLCQAVPVKLKSLEGNEASLAGLMTDARVGAKIGN
jgi:hypothetical protein